MQPNIAPTPAPDRDFVLDRQGPAFATFLIEDLADLIEKFEDAGVAMMGNGQMFEVRDGVFIAFARDPEGNCLEFVEYADITAYRPELG